MPDREPDNSQARRRALWALLLVVPAPSIGAAMSFWVAPGAFGAACYAAGKIVLYGLPIAWHRLVDRQPWSLSPARRGGWGVGLVSGVVIALAIQLAWWIVRGPDLDLSGISAAARENGFDRPGRFLAVAAWLSFVNAALEEYAFRWFITSRFRTLLRPRSAVVLSAVAFTIHHVIVLRAFFDWPITLVASAGVFVGGLVWSACYDRFGSIWPGYVSHVLVDISVMIIGWQVLFGT